MGRCFVMQPFDGGSFDERYEDVLAPAIIDAGLEPYRVDRDPNVTIPIEEIESGIRNADVCLAEISLDRPNVWYELGFAIASQKKVVLICIEDRRPSFPFDIQHRAIIRYRTESPRDFASVKEKVTDRLKAIIAKEAQLSSVSSLSPTLPINGLKNHETSCLICIGQSVDNPHEGVTAYSIRLDMERFDYTNIATIMALNSLMKMNMVVMRKDKYHDTNGSYVYSLTEQGFHWLEANQDRLVLQNIQEEEVQKPRSRTPPPPAEEDDDTDPFADE